MATAVSCSSEDNSSHKMEVAEMSAELSLAQLSPSLLSYTLYYLSTVRIKSCCCVPPPCPSRCREDWSCTNIFSLILLVLLP